ncbi:FlgN protein [Sanguibacter keddieii DSM 10542]|jgi:flagellar biosynthesis/type III secretory pathway chaperone|uniref:FlgN protein n=1 Tax=Sanguibacter keddieii (strain ATCC 51767 / DSM 10542 / NCFB 3025 / ST-74) TaxID=446469 RepID=D1BD25_SANKS|nr:flagellar export chaperone FlgN [Sanguibacter keddieii]ACZ23029.1 FlgN protein [Sanguibacter keddieii DSM 10542]
MSLQALSSVLWRERQLLELLLFKLEEEQLLLTSGKTRWLGHATREVENVLEQIREVELGRSVESDAVARLHGLEPGRSLHELSEAVPAPWDDLLRTHRQAFLDITHQIESLAQGNRELLSASHRATQEALANLTQDSHTYDATGSTAHGESTARMLDQEF